MPTKLLGNLPPDKLNGLTRLEDRLLDDPEGTHVIVAIVNAGKVETDTDTGEQTVKVRIRQVEAVLGAGDAESVRRILLRALEDRLGRISIDGFDELFENLTDDHKRMELLLNEHAKDPEEKFVEPRVHPDDPEEDDPEDSDATA